MSVEIVSYAPRIESSLVQLLGLLDIGAGRATLHTSDLGRQQLAAALDIPSGGGSLPGLCSCSRERPRHQ
jgi:hypothetical protein